MLHRTPAVINDPMITLVVQAAAKSVVGEKNLSSDQRTMGSEYFAFFGQEIPSCYFLLGSANAERRLTAHHTTGRVSNLMRTS